MGFKELLDNDIFRLFLIISLGKLLERIRIRSFSLGIASIFVIAAVFGYYGFSLPASYQVFGLTLFIYCVGIEAGPTFFSLFHRKGMNWAVVTVLHIGLSLVLTASLWLLFRQVLSKGTMIGLFSGSLTCTPAMASVIGHLRDGDIGAAFGIIYPLSLIGNIYFVPLLPRLLGLDTKKLVEDHEKEHAVVEPKRMFAVFRVDNPNIVGKTITHLRSFGLEGVVYTRYIEGDSTRFADDSVELHDGGRIGAVCSAEDVERLATLIGEPEEAPLPEQKDLVVKTLVVTRPTTAGKTIAELGLARYRNLKITRIARSGVEFPPTQERQLLLGDRLTLFGTVEGIAEFKPVAGDDVEEMYKTQFAPISIGVLLGMLVGIIPLPFLGYSLGITGGVLIVSMILGWKVKLAGVLWQIPHQTNDFLKQLALYIFFAVVGTNAGHALVQLVTKPAVITLLAVSITLAFLPVFLCYSISVRLLRKNPLEMLGLIAGNVNSSSVLASVDDKLGTDIPNLPFSFAYPLSLILTIMATEVLGIVYRVLK